MTRKTVPLNTIRLSIVVTVYSETFSIDETIKILLGKDRGYIQEILLLTSPRASEETFSICRQWVEQEPRVKVVVQQNNPGIGWAYREGMEAAKGNYVALMAADLETEPAAIDRMVQKLVETGLRRGYRQPLAAGGRIHELRPFETCPQLDFSEGLSSVVLDPHR